MSLMRTFPITFCRICRKTSRMGAPSRIEAANADLKYIRMESQTTRQKDLKHIMHHSCTMRFISFSMRVFQFRAQVQIESSLNYSREMTLARVGFTSLLFVSLAEYSAYSLDGNGAIMGRLFHCNHLLSLHIHTGFMHSIAS